MDYNYKIVSIETKVLKKNLEKQKINQTVQIEFSDGKEFVTFYFYPRTVRTLDDNYIIDILDAMQINGLLDLPNCRDRFSLKFNEKNEVISATSNSGFKITKEKVLLAQKSIQN